MKLIHISDLHLGKRVNEISMLEEQEYILAQIISIIDGESPDALIIAGDVYDKPIPQAEAIRLFDDFLCRLAQRSIQVFVISGNHDSPERIAFGGRLMDASGIHMSPVYSGCVEPFTLTDRFGELRVYMLPFIKPTHVRRYYPEAEIESYTDAVRIAVEKMNVDSSVRNVLVTHQFVTGASRSESEEISVGGSDNVDASVFAPFDYTALGHIHSPQNAGGETVRYCGTPLKYSFSEVKDKKSVTVIEMAEKGNVAVRTAELTPRHDMREIKGTYLELTARSNYEHTDTNDYLHVTLTDEEDIPDAIMRLRVIYPNLMKLDYDNKRTRAGGVIAMAESLEKKSPTELFAQFYEMQNNQTMNESQTALVAELIEKIWEGEQ